MNKWVRRVGAGALVVAGLGAVAVAVALQLAERRQHRHVDVAVAPLAAPPGTVSVERGGYLFRSRGCAECHGANGGGRTFVDEGGLVLAGPQIAAGRASVTATYQETDWVRTIRHGVKPDGRPLMIMPSEDYNRLTDGDVASLIAYVKQLPAVDGTPARVQLPLPVRVLYALGAIDDAATMIDHRLPPQQPVPEGLNVEHGKYVANMCIGCHGEHLSGGKIPGTPPEWPPAANLTPGDGSAMVRYADAKALTAMFRSGKRPDGSAVRVMPFETLAQMSDVDVGALHVYLKTLPSRAAGNR